MERISRVIGFIWVVMVAAGTVTSADLDLSLDLGQDGFERLVDHLAEAVDMPGAPAKPLGPTGFSLEVGGFWLEADDEAGWWQSAVSGSSDLLDGTVGYRAAVRKGLPWDVDVGLQAGSVLGADYYSVEGRYALVHGGVGRPSVGTRVVWTQLAEGPVDLELATAQVTVSKGFKILTPYAGAGMRWVWADASLGEGDVSLALEVDESAFVVSGGVQIKLMPLHVIVELRHAAQTALFASAGFAF